MNSRVALVTGAGRGIGRACSVELAGAGARVAITARSHDEISRVAAEVRDAGGEAHPIVDDLSDSEAPARIVEQVRQVWGPVEILVNNAGIGSSQNPKPLIEFDDAFWDLTFTVNVRAPYLLTKLVLPGMFATGWGRIINIASINAKIPALHGAAYAASKHALAGLTKATAKEAAARGVTANAVCPGVTATQMNDKRVEYDANRLGQSFEEVEAQSSPLGRRLLPAEIAALVGFLASEGAGAINGQMINVCGGTVMV